MSLHVHLSMFAELLLVEATMPSVQNRLLFLKANEWHPLAVDGG